MAKRDASEHSEDEEEVTATKPTKKAKKSSDETGERVKSKKQGAETQSNSVATSSEGEKYIDLGKKRRATVRSFKGVKMIDIREFYEKDNEDKPGKKGIALTLEQWNTLKSRVDELDSFLAEL